ncbi:hypothetical protein L7F22_051667 [Adiantum nelumboides]|nr:hypothetical protein [Adiantum nelumboides]
MQEADVVWSYSFVLLSSALEKKLMNESGHRDKSQQYVCGWVVKVERVGTALQGDDEHKGAARAVELQAAKAAEVSADEGAAVEFGDIVDGSGHGCLDVSLDLDLLASSAFLFLLIAGLRTRGPLWPTQGMGLRHRKQGRSRSEAGESRCVRSTVSWGVEQRSELGCGNNC